MKLEHVGKKNSRSLYGSFLWMTLLPLCIFGLAMIGTCTVSIRNTIKERTEDKLRSVARLTLESYDEMVEGDYTVTFSKTRTTLWKGDTILSGNYEFLDKIANIFNVDISLFYYDTRMLTTITDEKGDRVIDTGINTTIFDEVYNRGREVFYDNIRIAGVDYFSFYMPVYDSTGTTCIGMIGVAEPSNVIGETVRKYTLINLGIILLAMIITSFFIVKFASQIVSVIKKMMEFLKELSENNLKVTLDEGVSHRGDELGVMGKSMIKLQGSVKKLIERDVLTGLYNRRSAEKQIDEIEKGYRTYCVAIGDIDHFKKFNDTFGHECGDVVLKEVAKLLNEQMHNKGFVARWGGEEFLLVYPNTEIDEAYIALLAVRDELHKRDIEYDGQIHKVTMTFGVEQKKEGLPINLLIRAADDKLYEGKQTGRDKVCR